ncbi:MAG: glycosyltransferase [Flavobacteriales bacterium]|nr:glycosyltransferase [Flavobacteriales bacterium]
MLPSFRQYARVRFLSDYYEASRLAYWVKPFFVGFISARINHSKSPVVIFWHRESIEDVWPHISPRVPVMDVVHNSIADSQKQDAYLNIDMTPRINLRVAVTEGLRQLLAERYAANGLNPDLLERVTVTPHCVPLAVQPVQKTYGTRVVFLGRDSMEKRFGLFCRIARASRAENLPFTFAAIGPRPQDHPGVERDVHLYGTIDDVRRLQDILNESHILLLTSSSEGFPKAVAEAMTFGLVPVATDVGFVRDYVENRRTGFLISPEPDQVVEQALDALRMLTDPSLFLQISEQARQQARDAFDMAAFASAWKQNITVCRRSA